MLAAFCLPNQTFSKAGTAGNETLTDGIHVSTVLIALSVAATQRHILSSKIYFFALLRLCQGIYQGFLWFGRPVL